jgi:outer membrane protein, heavy metal efflux system
MRLRLAATFFLALAGISLNARAAPAADDVERVLAETVRVRDLVQLALARNPDVGERRARSEAARARIDLAGRLPETALRYEQRGLPLSRPLSYQNAESVMVGVMQMLPPPGVRRARTEMAAAEAKQATLAEKMRRRELTAEVRRAFSEYYRADRQLRLHRDHAEITARLVELARASYRAGRRGQQDVVRLGLELARVHGDVAHMEPELRASKALVNLLVNRPPEAPLGPPEEISLPPAPAAADPAAATARREELATAEAAIARGQAALSLAEREGRWPSLSLGLDYMYMPMSPHQHGYTAMVAINLPWLSGAKRDEARAAAASLRAEEQALVATRNALRYDIEEARARLEAAHAQFLVIDRDITGQARRNLEAAESAYAAGNTDALTLLDALRTMLEVSVDRVRALAHVETAAADLARARGEEVLP